jgi:hypothetical protein
MRLLILILPAIIMSREEIETDDEDEEDGDAVLYHSCVVRFRGNETAACLRARYRTILAWSDLERRSEG